MDFLDILKKKAFLGREFLTWLWFKSDAAANIIQLPDGNAVEVFFLDRMILDLFDMETPQTVALKGEQSGLREGLSALREGKKIEEARLAVRTGDNEFTMTLKATWFSFGGFKTPPIMPAGDGEEDEGTEGAFLEKAYLIEEGMDIVDALLHVFLKLRLSPAWEAEELPEIRRWIAVSSS